MNLLKKIIVCSLMCLVGISAFAKINGGMNEPDKVYLFSYCTEFDEGKSGLKFAWSPDGNQWLSIGSGWAFVKSDFGPWGSFKAMFNPHLQQSKTDGTWYCTWELT